jgi:hypothetical protein
MDHIGTIRNKEKTGNRNDLAGSNSLRRVPDVRHQDLDKFQYDPKTDEVEMVFEFTSQHAPKAMKMTKRIAADLGAWCCLVHHEWLDDDNAYPITVTLWEPYLDEDGSPVLNRFGKKQMKVVEEVNELEMSWEEFEDICHQVHEIYASK